MSVQAHNEEVDARERVLSTAYELFARNGIRAVGVDRIVREAGVAKMTLYRHFPSKDDLVQAALDRREELWTNGWLVGEVRRRASTPVEQLLAVFDAIEDWTRSDGFDGCLFIASLLEGRGSPAREYSAAKLANVRAFVHQLAEEAGLPDPATLARQWQTLMAGVIVMAEGGDTDAARSAREAAEAVLARRGRLPAAPD